MRHLIGHVSVVFAGHALPDGTLHATPADFYKVLQGSRRFWKVPEGIRMRQADRDLAMTGSRQVTGPPTYIHTYMDVHACMGRKWWLQLSRA